MDREIESEPEQVRWLSETVVRADERWRRWSAALFALAGLGVLGSIASRFSSGETAALLAWLGIGLVCAGLTALAVAQARGPAGALHSLAKNRAAVDDVQRVSLELASTSRRVSASLSGLLGRIGGTLESLWSVLEKLAFLKGAAERLKLAELRVLVGTAAEVASKLGAAAEKLELLLRKGDAATAEDLGELREAAAELRKALAALERQE
jgi:hypothetical protein